MLAPPTLWLLGRPIPFQFSQYQTAPSRYRNLAGRHQKYEDPATIAGVYWAGDPLLKKKKVVPAVYRTRKKRLGVPRQLYITIIFCDVSVFMISIILGDIIFSRED